MTEIEGRAERVKITLPLPADERARIAATLAACDVALAEFYKACDAAWAEYVKVRKAAWAEYVKVRDVARADCMTSLVEYHKVRDMARAECDKVHEAAWAECAKARDAAWAKCGSVLAAWIWREFGGSRAHEANWVLGELRDGATLQGLQEGAKDREWCEVWDDALARAMSEFDIS